MKNNQEFKKVSFQLDHAPKWEKPFNWQGMALAVITVASIVAIILIFVAFKYRVNWS